VGRPSDCGQLVERFGVDEVMVNPVASARHVY